MYASIRWRQRDMGLQLPMLDEISWNLMNFSRIQRRSEEGRLITIASITFHLSCVLFLQQKNDPQKAWTSHWNLLKHKNNNVNNWYVWHFMAMYGKASKSWCLKLALLQLLWACRAPPHWVPAAQRCRWMRLSSSWSLGPDTEILRSTISKCTRWFGKTSQVKPTNYL